MNYSGLKEDKRLIEAVPTARQIAYKLGFSDLNAVKPRLTELRKAGKIKAIGKAYDETTQRNVTVYRAVIW